MLTLDWPWLLLLLPLPWLVQRFVPATAEQQAALRVPFYDQVSQPQTVTARSRRSMAGSITLWLLWLLLLLSAARPLWIGEPMPVAQSGRDLMLAVDISGSMGAEDMQLDDEAVNRLVAVKAVLSEFIERRSGDRLGLILFGTQAYIQTPLTFDHQALNQLLQEAQIGFAGDKTAIGDAIGLGIKRLQNSTRAETSANRVIILLTDGANTEGKVTPLDAATKAAEQKVRVYTLGFGADEMLVRSLFGVRKVNPSADLDETTLKSIAEQTQGRYFRARDVDELQQIYQLLDQLEPSQQSEQLIRPQQALFHWPLALALLLSLMLALKSLWLPLVSGRRRRPL